MTVDKFARLVEQLAQTSVPADAFNQYAFGNDHNTARRNNLLLYLRQMADFAPKTLLLGEAPSYRGSRLTGIPMTSRAIMLNGLTEFGLFGTARGYQRTFDPGFDDIQREQTATIVWQTLTEQQFVPLIWGTFPFHPHEPGQPRTNRMPRREEIEIGSTFVTQIVELFGIQQIVAVGNVAEMALKKLEVNHTKIRHPSHGGKNEFVQGIRSLLGKP